MQRHVRSEPVADPPEGLSAPLCTELEVLRLAQDAGVAGRVLDSVEVQDELQHALGLGRGAQRIEESAAYVCPAAHADAAFGEGDGVVPAVRVDQEVASSAGKHPGRCL